MKRYILDREYSRMLAAFGVSAEEALRRAGAPEDTFVRETPTMTAEDYFAFMEAVGQLAAGEDAAVRMASAQGIEQFSPPIFASYCARDGRACIERLMRYKRLIGPMEFIVDEKGGLLSVEMTCGDADLTMPGFLVQVEFSFLVNLLHTATRQHIGAAEAQMQEPPEGTSFSAFLGCEPQKGPRNVLAFVSTDMDVPFVSHNDAMWSYFEPELGRRLAELEVDESLSARVRSALVEMLPAGECGADDVARRLGMSRRTMQRKLGEEGTTFQRQFNHTRELLAKHYLTTTSMGTDQIAYLLGYLELNSFLRAFNSWCGMSPSEWRKRNTTD
ncbi:AraC family transcriptional regulator [Olsenella sp. Marseille-P4559]|uniref:AraC family transcriptional regulator n=1 Tax=Olsenella sp. Marseille-P4559 TaxID=2364795 RepID=UPI00103232A9|nr:AraC family transcriptional regulator [Olsenella sp. Marseille-P4559]